MTLYEVVWKIDINAEFPMHAAVKALEIQRDATSTATHFTVRAHDSYEVTEVDVSDYTFTGEENIKKDGPVEATTNPRQQLLTDALNAVSRTQEYGSPEDSFRLIADLWNQWVKARGIGLEPGQWKFTPADVAVMLMLLKVARLMSKIDHRDSIVDIAGYAACLAEIVQEGETS